MQEGAVGILLPPIDAEPSAMEIVVEAIHLLDLDFLRVQPVVIEIEDRADSIYDFFIILLVGDFDNLPWLVQRLSVCLFRCSRSKALLPCEGAVSPSTGRKTSHRIVCRARFSHSLHRCSMASSSFQHSVWSLVPVGLARNVVAPAAQLQGDPTLSAALCSR